jgi:hypothetical protein
MDHLNDRCRHEDTTSELSTILLLVPVTHRQSLLLCHMDKPPFNGPYKPTAP